MGAKRNWSGNSYSCIPILFVCIETYVGGEGEGRWETDVLKMH